jgi:hypothetical protein
MRTYFALSILLSLAMLIAGACQPLQDGAIKDAVRDGIAAADSDGDGTVSRKEIRDVKNDPMFWITIANSLAAMFGLAKANSAAKQVAKVEHETDQQWDEIRKPLP